MAPMREPLPDPIEGVFDDSTMGLGPSEEERMSGWLEDLWTQGPVASLSLQQVVGGGGTCPVRDWIDQELTELGDPSNMANEIMAAAQEDCESSGQFSRYCVTATRPGAASYFRRFFFTLQAPAIDQAGFASEFGAEGLVSAAHRHVEQIMRIGLGSAAASLRSVIQQNHDLAGLARSAWTSQAEAARAREQLLDRSLQRDMLLAQHASIQERKDRVRKWSEALIGNLGVPALLHHVGAPATVVAQAAAIGAAMTGMGGIGAPPPQTGGKSGADVKLAATELSQLDAISLAVAVDLAALDDSVWAMAMAQLPTDARGPFRRARQAVLDAAADDRKSLDADEGTIVRAMGRHLLDLMTTLDDQRFELLLAQANEANRGPLRQFRAIVRARAAQAPPPPAPAAAPTPTATPAANGAP